MVTTPPIPLIKSENHLTRRGLERLDLLLLVVESLDLNGGEAIYLSSVQLGLQDLIPNRVELWKKRCYNPLRRSTRRGQLSSSDVDGLIQILCFMSDRLYPLLQTLLSSKESDEIRNQRSMILNKRLRELVSQRLNPRRGAVQKLLDTTKQFVNRDTLLSLALASGPGGIERIKASLLDCSS